MKKITYIVISLLLMVSYSYGQGEVEANQFSRNDLTGTARAMSMGGAFGALGGDLTGVSINPAGIAVYRSSEIAATAVFENLKFKAGDVSNTKNSFNFHNLGFVGYFPTRNASIPVVNFGFSYNKVKSFDREIGAFGADRGSSIMDYMAFLGTADNVDPVNMQFDTDDEFYDPFLSGAPWLSVLGYQSFLINPGKDELGNFYTPLHNETVNNSLYMSERGSIDVYDFTVGAAINSVLNVGLSLSVSDISYNLYSQNSEDFATGANAGFDLHNWLETDGNGVGVKVGVIYRPINALRLGLSYHSPTWYNMTDRFEAQIDEDVTEYVNKQTGEYADNYIKDYKPGTTFSGEKRFDYDFKTPDKWTASAALVLGSNMIVSMDYELTNYGSMKFSEVSGAYVRPEESYDQNANVYIKEDHTTSSTIRTGLEYRFTPQFSGRLGYAWMQNPYKSSFKNDRGNAMTAGATSAFRMEGDTNYFTGGIGYRFSRSFYADLAVMYKTQDDDLYAYPNVLNENGGKFIDAAPYKLTNNAFKAMVTLGYRF